MLNSKHYHYSSLLVSHLTLGKERLEFHTLHDGSRAVIEFSPLDAGQQHEANNERQRYEIIVRPLKEGA